MFDYWRVPWEKICLGRNAAHHRITLRVIHPLPVIFMVISMGLLSTMSFLWFGIPSSSSFTWCYRGKQSPVFINQPMRKGHICVQQQEENHDGNCTWNALKTWFWGHVLNCHKFSMFSGLLWELMSQPLIWLADLEMEKPHGMACQSPIETKKQTQHDPTLVSPKSPLILATTSHSLSRYLPYLPNAHRWTADFSHRLSVIYKFLTFRPHILSHTT